MKMLQQPCYMPRTKRRRLFLFKVERLLLCATNGLAPLGRLHPEDAQLRISLETRHILRGDENKLAVVHLLCDLHKSLHGNLTSDRIEENVELVHDAEGRLEALADGKKEGEGGKTPLASTQGFDVPCLAVLVRVVLAKTRKKILRCIRSVSHGGNAFTGCFRELTFCTTNSSFPLS